MGLTVSVGSVWQLSFGASLPILKLGLQGRRDLAARHYCPAIGVAESLALLGR